MALLIRLFLLSILIFVPVAANASSRPLLDFKFDGYIQGRFTGFIINTDKSQGPLNSLFDPALPGSIPISSSVGAGGEYETMATIKRLEFSLGTKLSNSGWSVKAKGSVPGSKAKFKTAYLKWSPTPDWSCQTGLIPVPFGLENQISSSALVTTERALIYSFGNFGWAEPLGLQVVDQYAYGVSVKVNSRKSFANFNYFFQTALVTGNGRQVLPSLPTQLVFRTGIINQINIENFRHQFNWSVSVSHGWNQFKEQYEYYIPVGSPGDLNSHPEEAVRIDYLGPQGHTTVFGTDLTMRMNELVLSGEWIMRNINHQWIQGYYLSGRYELFNYIEEDVELVIKWEDIMSTVADGIHRPNCRYQAVTIGANWDIISDWRLQINYIALLKDFKLHQFTGSDLIISQLQFKF